MATYNIGPGQTYETFTALIAAETLTAGDIVDGGDNTFREQWWPDGSGTNGNPIIIRDAKVSGADVLSTSGWTLHVPAATTYVSDTFDRDNAAGWGTADGGSDTDKTWDGGDVDYSISSNLGAYTNAWGYGRNGVGDSHTDVDVKADFSGIGADWDREYGFFVRISGGNSYFCHWNPSSNTLFIKKDPGGVTLDSEVLSDPGASFTVRFQVSGSTTVTLKAKVWTGAEPDWQVSTSDSSSPHASGTTEVWVGNAGAGNARVNNFSLTSIAAVYSYTYQKALATDPGSYVLEDGVLMTKVASIAEVEATECSFYWASDIIYVHATGGGDPTSNGKVYETPIRNIIFALNERDYITFQNLTVEMSTYVGLWVTDDGKQDGITVDSCTFRYMSTGMLIHGDDCTVKDSSFSNAALGIELRDIDDSHSQNFLIESNSFTDMGSATSTNAGIMYDSDTYADNSDFHQGITRYNYFKNIQGRAMDGFLGNSTIIYNVVDTVTTGAAGSAIAIEINGKNNTIYNNIIYDAANMGIFVNTDPVAGDVANTIKNNVMFCASASHLINVAADVAADPVIDYNDYWVASGGESKYTWKGTTYNFTDWKTNSSQDANSKEANPLMVDPANGDFQLQLLSPCINAGTNVSLTQDYAGHTVPNPAGTNPDIGAYEYVQQDPNAGSLGDYGLHLPTIPSI